ncbi:SH3 domain-containing protein [Elusimicrobiota bacterium]
MSKYMAKKIKLFLMLVACSIFINGCSIQKTIQSNQASPVMLGIEKDMKVPGYWISVHPYPDVKLLDREDIDEINSNIEEVLQSTINIKDHSEIFPLGEVIPQINNLYKSFTNKKYYTTDGTRVDSDYFKNIEENMNLGSIGPGVELKFGIIVHYADQRLIPTKDALSRKKRKANFDRVQNNSLDIGTPVVIKHVSKDGKWYYAEGPSSAGWIAEENIVICSREETRKFLKQNPFIVVTSPKAQIFLDENFINYYDYVRMGVKLPLIRRENVKDKLKIEIPSRANNGKLEFKEVYMSSKEVNDGYLPYTPRNVINQAFKMMNAPYAWGGIHGEQDCSQFIQQVFATFGVNMPRNSLSQSSVGKFVGGEWSQNTSPEKKVEILDRYAIGGITTLYLDGHIMLFVGMVDGVPYVIHEMWGYGDKIGNEEIVRIAGRVIVSSLSIGEGSKKGSLIERVKAIRVIGKQFN